MLSDHSKGTICQVAAGENRGKKGRKKTHSFYSKKRFKELIMHEARFWRNSAIFKL